MFYAFCFLLHFKSIFLIRQHLTPDAALQKAKHFCAYQERCHGEVKEKLYSYGLKKYEVELLLSRLIEEDYLNEERFAMQFAGGRFRLKHWGKIKIKHELKQKQVSEYIINKAMKSIDMDDYLLLLEKLCRKKWEEVSNERLLQRLAKTRNYLLQKGFEPNLVTDIIKQVQNEPSI